MTSYNETLTFLVPITILFCVTAIEDESAESPECSKIHSVKEICTLTLYPNSRYNSLVKNLAPNDTIQPDIIYVKSVQAAMAEVSRTTRDFSENGMLQILVIGKIQPFLQWKLVGSFFLLPWTTLKLKSSFLINGSSLEKSHDNIRSWLSTATTDIQTCGDGFEDLSKQVRKIAVAKMKNSTEYTSNTLAIVTEIWEM